MRTAGEKEKAWMESVEKADLVSDATISPSCEKGLKSTPDLGNFTSVQGTPSKIYPSLDLVQSPIISKTGRKY